MKIKYEVLISHFDMVKRVKICITMQNVKKLRLRFGKCNKQFVTGNLCNPMLSFVSICDIFLHGICQKLKRHYYCIEDVRTWYRKFAIVVIKRSTAGNQFNCKLTKFITIFKPGYH